MTTILPSIAVPVIDTQTGKMNLVWYAALTTFSKIAIQSATYTLSLSENLTIAGSSGLTLNNSGAATVNFLSGTNTYVPTSGTGATGTWSISVSGNAATATSATTSSTCSGNAATVTNGVYTTDSWTNPSWIVSLPYSKITGTPVLDNNTYTPTLTNTTNVASSTAFQCQYLRVGNTVTVSGKLSVTPTAASSTATVLGISLPIASTIGAEENCCGTAVCPTIASDCAAILGDSSNHRASMKWLALSTAAQAFNFSFSYLVI